jgi:predicted RND superfamily exporter protein|tara:strand:+ start:276 stop:680 length:405 start_codon:yes stop_codon:yes gene_type:complete
MKKVLLPLILLFSLNSINSQENYKSLLIEYMTAQGQFETFNATIDQMGTMMGVTIKNEDREEFTNDVMGSLIELLVPVYQKHFTVEDLKDAIQMYKTPIGKKISEKTPIIAQETMQASMQWGMELSQKMQKYLE